MVLFGQDGHEGTALASVASPDRGSGIDPQAAAGAAWPGHPLAGARQS